MHRIAEARSNAWHRATPSTMENLAMAATEFKNPPQVQRQIDWKAGVWSGVVAGLVFLMLEMGLVWLFQGESPWGPPRMIAAMALGKDVLPQPGTWATFDLAALLVALVIHFALAIVYGLIGAAVLGGMFANRLGYGAAIAIGAAAGLAVYLINFYPIAAAMFPWFAMARGWIGLFSHIMFGAVAGAVYVKRRNYAYQ